MVAAAAALADITVSSGCDTKRPKQTTRPPVVVPPVVPPAKPRVLLVGLGAGSCAAALMHLLAGVAEVEAVENDAAVLRAASEAHGHVLSIDGSLLLSDGPLSDETAKRARRTAAVGASPIRVTLADAAEHIARLPALSVHCLVLDAYDAKGVPAHLQVATLHANGTSDTDPCRNTLCPDLALTPPLPLAWP
jgi:hypothetical protein